MEKFVDKKDKNPLQMTFTLTKTDKSDVVPILNLDETKH